MQVNSKELLSKLGELEKAEERAFAHFEHRLRYLDSYKRDTRLLIKLLSELEKMRINPDSEIGNIKKKIKSAVETAEKIQKDIYRAFYSFDLPKEMNLLAQEEMKVLESDISESMEEYKELTKIKGEVIELSKEEITALVKFEENEKFVVEVFERRVIDFKVLINDQKDELERQVRILDYVRRNLEKSFNNINLEQQADSLRSSLSGIEGLIKKEKEIVHDPIGQILKKKKHYLELINSLVAKKGFLGFSKKITQQDIVKDIRTFSSPNEFNNYRNIILRLKYEGKLKLDQKAEDMLIRGSVFSQMRLEKEQQDREHRLFESTKDTLTGVRNRASLETVASTYDRNAHSPGFCFSILFLDIDYFGQFNKIYGHFVGDDVLKAVVGWTQEELRRAGDLIFRWGGEEFLVLLPDTHKRNAEEMAWKINKGVREKSERIMREINHGRLSNKKGEMPYITVSIGVASWPEDIRDPSKEKKAFDMINHYANNRLKKAKEKRNDVVAN